MAPRKHVAKSQEHVYKKIGKGIRERYKLVAQSKPRNTSSTSLLSTSEPLPSAPPLVTAPQSPGANNSFDDIPHYTGEGYDSTTKKKSKVSESN
jgi:hypothetical protein